jgi:hypothetical protein
VADDALYRLRCGDLLVVSSPSTMKAVWVDERVEAMVEFSRGVAFPRLRGIRFRDETIEFAGPIRVDRTPSALLYQTSAAERQYTVRFEIAGQRWVLEAIRDAAPSN